jgi:anhydro-N-acetylmuramic acid kinase
VPQSLDERIKDIASRPDRLVVGLSSGTSFDGVDAAVVRISGRDDVHVELVGFFFRPFERELRARIAEGPSMPAARLARLSFDLGEVFAEAALEAVRRSGVPLKNVCLVGSHGQTVFHDPPRPGRPGVTLQIGEADVIARRTGITTVSDFRTADVAAGGSGAPLVPLVDWLLFRRPGERQIFLNIGGIANITCVTERLEDVVAFDTGPGNALVDEIMRSATGDSTAFDEGGARALMGSVDTRAVETFLSQPYFSAPAPKSTGKELFGREAAARLTELVLSGAVPGRPAEAGTARSAGAGAETVAGEDLNDLLATAARITAMSVRGSIVLLPPGADISRIVVSGGGLRNGAIMRDLENLFAPVPVVGLDSLGIDPDAMEALAFAVLADRSVAGRPGNLPGATGASDRVVLGKISSGM